MALGPVLRYELITTSRRGRYYAARVLYGVFLLYSLSQEYQQSVALRRAAPWYQRPSVVSTSEETIREMTRFAQSAFLAFAWSQWVAVAVVVPALTAGVIADAHRRKTLRDLLSSGFSARSIVLGKLGARLVHVATFALLGLPVVALVGLFGGLDPWWVFYAYAGAASMALGLGGVSILASTLARRPRDAILLAYLLEGAWLIVPLLLQPIVRYLTWPFYLLEPWNDLALASNPVLVWSEWRGFRDMSIFNTMPGTWLAMRSDELYWGFLRMAGLQSAVGLGCVWLAVALLRPLRSGDGEATWAATRARVRRRLGRSPVPTAARERPWWRSAPVRVACGDDPMWWKERRASTRGGLAWAVGRPFVLFLGTLLGCYLFDVARPSLWNVASLGYYRVNAFDRVALNEATRLTAACLTAFWLLAVASAGAVALISEREDDTWTSLTATLLTGPEVVRAKVLGALWGTRRLALALLAVIAVGVLGGGVHPLGAVAGVLGLAAFGGFAAALGVSLSLRARSSGRAMVGTVILLVLVNAGPTFFAQAARARGVPSIPGVGTLMPLLEWVSLLSYSDARALWNGREILNDQLAEQFGPTSAGWYLTALAFYGISALGLTAASGASFDAAAGRARRGAPAAILRQRRS